MYHYKFKICCHGTLHKLANNRYICSAIQFNDTVHMHTVKTTCLMFNYLCITNNVSNYQAIFAHYYIMTAVAVCR